MCTIPKNLYYSYRIGPDFIKEFQVLHELTGDAWKFVESECANPGRVSEFKKQLQNMNFAVLAEQVDILVQMNEIYSQTLLAQKIEH